VLWASGRVVATLVLALALLPARAARSEGAESETRLPGVSTWLTGRELHVEAKLNPGLPRDDVERLSSGLPTTVLWRVRLFAFRNLWWDGLKDERKYEVTATYRPVAGDFLVEKRLDDRLIGSQVVPTRAEALTALSEVPGLPLFLMGPHLEGKRLVVRVKCLYGRSVALGVVPTTAETPWVRSGGFDWPPPERR
jgi:hypothetical protein